MRLLRTGGVLASSSGETRNLSSAGVLFTVDQDVPVGSPIEYLIRLPEAHKDGKVELRCQGKVVRHDHPNCFAATVERYEFVRGAPAG